LWVGMKSQDILLLLKLHSIELHTSMKKASDAHVARLIEELEEPSFHGWGEEDTPKAIIDYISVRNLSLSTGIGKTEVGNIINRCIHSGIAFKNRRTGNPAVNRKALAEFLIYGAKFVFPATLGKMTRGIPTSFSAPVMDGKIFSTGETKMVWPDPFGREKGETLEPIYKSVPMAVKRDLVLYELLALFDVIRTGNPREAGVASDMIAGRLK